MGQPVVHFEITGRDPVALREYFGALFGWTFDTSGAVSDEISQPGTYGFVNRNVTSDGTGIPGGVGGGEGYIGHAVFYMGVPEVEAALQHAEQLGGTRVLGPAKRPDGGLVVGQFTDPEGNLVGVAGPQ
jgi:uncharacterized protein